MTGKLVTQMWHVWFQRAWVDGLMPAMACFSATERFDVAGSSQTLQYWAISVMRSSSEYEVRVFFFFFLPSAGGVGGDGDSGPSLEDSGSSPVVFRPALAQDRVLVRVDLRRGAPLLDLHGPALSLHFFYHQPFCSDVITILLTR